MSPLQGFFLVYALCHSAALYPVSQTLLKEFTMKNSQGSDRDHFVAATDVILALKYI